MFENSSATPLCVLVAHRFTRGDLSFFVAVCLLMVAAIDCPTRFLK